MWLRIILGGLYAAMAAGQAASWSRMPTILGAYQAVPTGALPWLAAVLIAAEAGCGLWLLTRPRSRAWAPVWLYTVVTGVWALLAVQAQVRGLPVANCGCFGVYLGQRLSGLVLAQDALLLGYAALMIRGTRRARRGRPTPGGRLADRVATVGWAIRGGSTADGSRQDRRRPS